jgi:hypothetical protein
MASEDDFLALATLRRFAKAKYDLAAISVADFEHAKARGIMFDPLEIDHAEAIASVRRVTPKVAKRDVTAGFMATLPGTSGKRQDLATLASWAIGRLMSEHELVPSRFTNGAMCKTCWMPVRKRACNLNA